MPICKIQKSEHLIDLEICKIEKNRKIWKSENTNDLSILENYKSTKIKNLKI
jgi:hypothetical protein